MIFISTSSLSHDVVRLEPDTWVRATVVPLNGWLEILGVSHTPQTSGEGWEVVDDAACCLICWRSPGGGVQVTGYTVDLLIIGTSLSLHIVLPAKVCRLDGVVCLKQTRRSVDAVILGSVRDLRLVALSSSIGWVQPLSTSALLLVSTNIGDMLLDLILATTFFGDYWKWRVDVVVATLPYRTASGVVGGR